MDQINQYASIIKDGLTAYAALLEKLPHAYEIVLVFDDERHQYLLRKIGWTARERIDGIVLHVSIRQGKIWIEEDWTEEGLATYLLAREVPAQDIVLGFVPPVERPYTEFAVA
ncbi:MAG: XisI protein [Ardenticatenaceae bacterium]|nr:XisI protein [Ardenticatenaceae bacterium]